MKIDILTLFPERLAHLGESILGRAADKGILQINFRQIREFTDNKQMQVDDYPYGGGWGCVMSAQPVADCLDSLVDSAKREQTRVIYMSPQGKVFAQEDAKRLAAYEHLVLVCGHYEGVDERFIEECVDEELSIGDFVLTGGEIPAMAVADAVCRLVPGVLADEECYTGESHWDGRLEYPQYTRPETWRGRQVPEVLLSGNHARIESWRREQSLRRTMERRPDLFAKLQPRDELDETITVKLIGEQKANKPVFDCRRADLADMDAILEIIAGASRVLRKRGVDQWQDGYPNAEVFSADIARGECWVFTCADKIAGVMAVTLRREKSYDYIEGSWLTDDKLTKYGAVHRFAVSSDFRGGGLAEEMLAFACDLCLGRGFSSVRLDTHPDNKRMRALLERCGFEHCGKVYLDYAEPVGMQWDAFEKTLEKRLRFGYEKTL